MPLRLEFPPDEITTVVRSTLLERSRKRRLTTPALSRSATNTLALAAPHPVFTLSLEDLVGEKGLQSASQVGWRYLVRQGDRTIAAAEVPLVAVDAEHGLQINEGQFVRATDVAIEELEDRQELREHDYELRLLRVSALYTVAIWLHASGDDIVMAIGQSDPAVETGELYPGDEFVERLRGPARTQLSFDTRPQDDSSTDSGDSSPTHD